VHLKSYQNINFSLPTLEGNLSFPKTLRGVSHVAANGFHQKLWKSSKKLLELFQMLVKILIKTQQHETSYLVLNHYTDYLLSTSFQRMTPNKKAY